MDGLESDNRLSSLVIQTHTHTHTHTHTNHHQPLLLAKVSHITPTQEKRKVYINTTNTTHSLTHTHLLTYTPITNTRTYTRKRQTQLNCHSSLRLMSHDVRIQFKGFKTKEIKFKCQKIRHGTKCKHKNAHTHCVKHQRIHHSSSSSKRKSRKTSVWVRNSIAINKRNIT